MKYTLIETSHIETIFTNVEFEFENGEKEIIEIAHFEPQSIEDIQQNIQNRYESELLIRQMKGDGE